MLSRQAFTCLKASLRDPRRQAARRRICLLGCALFLALANPRAAIAETPASDRTPRFEGKHYRGIGDVDYLGLLETARRMFEPDPELQNLTMLYEPKWNGLVEGPTWDAWWIQNSYGTTYSVLPWLSEPFITFLQNSQDLWFDQMGDGKRVGASAPFNWVAPDGCLCDAARPGWIVYKQGDGRTAIHDWGMEFTAAGIVLQSELLLISRDPKAIAHYLPMLERCSEFIETRRDPTNNLFLAGPAGNLLAPSYAGWRRPDGSYDKAYLAGLSVTYIAALDRLIELECLAGRRDKAARCQSRRDAARRGLDRLATAEGYFVRSLDPDGVKHGVFGAPAHGYFEASPNHDAIAFRIVDDSQAQKIYQKIAAIPGLRPHDFILPNYPSYDDMYEKPEGLWRFGTWVNGGHWSTCEARMILGYYRLGQFEDARRSMRRLLKFAQDFRMDNPLTQCGNAVYQPNQPVNLCYDTFGPAAALVRGLFEYLYTADSLKLLPHVPPGITELEQRDPIRFGDKRIFISTKGQGPVTGVRINSRKWKRFDPASVTLPYSAIPEIAHVQIALGNASLPPLKPSKPAVATQPVESEDDLPAELAALRPTLAKLRAFHTRLVKAGFADTYEAAHAALALQAAEVIADRRRLVRSGSIKPLPEPARAAAADRLFVDTATRLSQGLAARLNASTNASAASQRIRSLWRTD